MELRLQQVTRCHLKWQDNRKAPGMAQTDLSSEDTEEANSGLKEKQTTKKPMQAGIA